MTSCLLSKLNFSSTVLTYILDKNKYIQKNTEVLIIRVHLQSFHSCLSSKSCFGKLKMTEKQF